MYSKTFINVLANARTAPKGAEGKEQPAVAPPVTTQRGGYPLRVPPFKKSLLKNHFTFTF